jgi:hypothetical protein
METSAFQAYNEFLIIAMGVAVGYLGSVWIIMLAGRLVVRLRGSRPAACRPGELVHQALKVSGRLWDHYRTAALLFGVSFLLLVNFGREGWSEPMSTLINALVLLCLLLPLVYGALKVVQLVRYRLRLSHLLGLHMQMAQRLVEAQLRGNRVYPSVRINEFVLDNVIVGSNGIYTTQLIVPPSGSESAKYKRGGLIVQPGGARLNLQRYNQGIKDLASTLSAEVGVTTTVLPVVVMPDCRIEASESGGPMLVSLQACASFVSLSDGEFFLHDDDIAKICGWLGKQALEDPPRTLNAVVASLERQIEWPALV